MKRLLAVTVLVIIFASSCQTTTSGGQQNNISSSDAVKEMKTYFDNAVKKMDEMAISEGISQLVAVLAIYNSVTSPAEEVKLLAQKATTELTKIEAGLLLQPSAEWLEENMDQKAAIINVAEKGNQLSPAVILMYNIGGSRAAVSGAPVIFEFASGTGLLSSATATNEYGQAAAQVGRFDDLLKENVIRAQVIYRIKGFVYQFQTLKRDFIYRPATKRATILAYERAGDFISDDPLIFNKTYDVLKKNKFDFVPYNGKLMGDNFLKVFGGDLAAIKSLTLAKDATYLVMVFSDCYSIRQSDLRYAIYTADAKATLRIIRITDGKIMFEAVVSFDHDHGTHSQGGSVAAVRGNAFRRLAEAMETELGNRINEINTILEIKK
ncbi:MAG: hypothetical protein EHM28_08395 [Spirochaetaceae bacterium]|nr:MAG: hypothetical protein EHM28_08395 [Spirochaetaceae bacterium]